ncbi:hypothetical protein Btru_024633 [Bulinus truncatus]|nr:hypothetical protein Btru_024633 [Bulinus truncatus]
MANKLLMCFAAVMVLQVSSALFLYRPVQSPLLVQINNLRQIFAQALANVTAANTTAANTTASNTTASTTLFKPICSHLINHLSLFGNGTVPLLPTNLFGLRNVLSQGLAQLAAATNGTRTTNPFTNLLGNLSANLQNFLSNLQLNQAVAG